MFSDNGAWGPAGCTRTGYYWRAAVWGRGEGCGCAGVGSGGSFLTCKRSWWGKVVVWSGAAWGKRHLAFAGAGWGQPVPLSPRGWGVVKQQRFAAGNGVGGGGQPGLGTLFLRPRSSLIPPHGLPCFSCLSYTPRERRMRRTPCNLPCNHPLVGTDNHRSLFSPAIH